MRLGSALAVLAVGLAATAARAQAPSAAPPAATTAAPAATATPPAPPPAGAPAQAEGGAAADKKTPATTGGYSWSDKPRKRRPAARRVAKRTIDPKAPLATYPGFRMMPKGKSTVWVYVSRKVNVTVRRAAGRVSYVLAGAQVGIRNNTHPLVTHYFRTPLSRAWLRPDRGGAELVLELRENVQTKHRIIEGPGGTMLLKVELPRPTKSPAVTEPAPVDARKGQIVLPAPRR